jgi:hypothetical protein
LADKSTDIRSDKNSFLVYEMGRQNTYSPSQVPQQFTGTSTLGSWPTQSQFTGIPEQGHYNQTPSQLWWHQEHQQSNSNGSIGDMNASGCFVKPDPCEPMDVQKPLGYENGFNVQQVPQVSNQADTVPIPQPQPHNPPQHFHSDANTGGVASASSGASIQRDYRHAFRQSPSSISMSVPERFFNPGYQSPHYDYGTGKSPAPQPELVAPSHFNLPPSPPPPRPSISAPAHNFGLSPFSIPAVPPPPPPPPISAANQSSYDLTPETFLDFDSSQYPNFPQKSTSTEHAINNEDTSLHLRPGTVVGSAPHFLSQAANRIDSQHVNVVAGETHWNSEIHNADASSCVEALWELLQHINSSSGDSKQRNAYIIDLLNS